MGGDRGPAHSTAWRERRADDRGEENEGDKAGNGSTLRISRKGVEGSVRENKGEQGSGPPEGGGGIKGAGNAVSSKKSEYLLR